MRKTHVVASFALLVVVATIITQIPVSKPPLAHARGSDSFATPTRVVSQAARQHLVQSYGRLPLSFEANRGQTDTSVKFLSRGNGYTLFLTANEAVLALRKSEPRLSEPRPQGSGGLYPSRDRNGAVTAKVQILRFAQDDNPSAVNPPITPITHTSPAVIPRSVSDEGSFCLAQDKPALSSPSASSAKSADEAAGSSLVTRHSSLPPAVLRLKLVGANANAEVAGESELPGKSNYFIGNDPKQWRKDVPNYGKVRFAGVYPGVDLVYYGNQRQLEYDFVVAPGADPSAITLAIPSRDRERADNPSRDRKRAVSKGTGNREQGTDDPSSEGTSRPAVDREGAVPLRIDGQGDLVLGDEGSEIRWHKPVVYQEVGGVRQMVDGHYVRRGKEAVGFEVASYDPGLPLIIDPVLTYSTYLGGGSDDFGIGIAVDSFGNAYVTGNTVSINFPTPPGALDTSCGTAANCDGGFTDVFVTKLTAAGNALVYSTYLGGNGDDSGNGIAVDSSGNAYVTGQTESTNFPGTSSSLIQSALSGTRDAFVTKLNAAGSALVYSTYLGGSGDDVGRGIAVDSSGNAYVTGQTTSTTFPGTSSSPIQAASGGGTDAFVTKLNAVGNALVYSTYLGGNSTDVVNGIAVDSLGNAYVTGETLSTNFPGTSSSLIQSALSGVQDAFVTKLNAAGNALVYSTYLGGSGNEQGTGIAIDSSGNAYVSGSTNSTNFPTANAFQPASGGGFDAFVTKLNATGTAPLLYSTYLGGSSTDQGFGIAVDSSGNAYVTGLTQSSNFPGTSSSPIQSVNGGSADAFVTKLNATGTAPLLYSTYLGGSGFDDGFGIAVDSSGNAYVTGFTGSSNFPTTASPFQLASGGGADAFVSKISAAAPPPPSPPPVIPSPSLILSSATLNFTAFSGMGSNPPPQFLVITNSTGGRFGWTATITSITGGNWLTLSLASGQGAARVSLTVNANALPVGTFTAVITITAPGAANSPQTVTVSLTVAPRPTLVLSTTSLDFVVSRPGPAPAPQIVTVSFKDGVLNWTAATSTSSGGDWLTAIPTDETPPRGVLVSVKTLFIPEGTYQGTVTITAPDAANSPQAVEVTLTVGPPGTPIISLGPRCLLVFPASVTRSPAAQTFEVRNIGTGVLGWSATVATQSGGNWLVASPTTGVAPSVVTVAVNSLGLRPGAYVGTVTIAALPGVNASNSPQVCTVRMAVDAASVPPGGLVNSASFLKGEILSPGAIASIFGSNLASTTATAAASDPTGFLLLTSDTPRALNLPTTLGGVQVLVNNVPAPLFYVSPTQINFQMPFELSGSSAEIVVVSDGIAGVPTSVDVVPAAPGIFTATGTGTGQAAALLENFSPNLAQNPIAAGRVLLLFATGLGATNPPVAAGQAASASPLSVTVLPPVVMIGGSPAEVLFSGLAPELVGAYQINVRVPPGISAGNAVPVVLSIGGATSNTVTIAVQ